MKLILLEYNIYWENQQKNINRFEKDILQIKEHNPDMICLPEMSFTGFSMNASLTKDIHCKTVKKMKRLSFSNNTAIAFGWVGEDVAGIKNHYTIVERDEVRLDYEKIHPFSYGGEANVFTGGEKLSICDMDDFKVGVQICYDLRFPETFQILSKKADMIIVPANWPSKREYHWDVLLRARAIENQVYIVGVNCVGRIEGINYSGHSIIVSPDGTICKSEAITLDSGSVAYLYEINNNVNEYRNSFPVKADRREELYRELRV